tara:strand:+ start:8778 stop:9302 length:525 start_codon:yes stop_codon:yes gene_type:complete
MNQQVGVPDLVPREITTVSGPDCFWGEVKRIIPITKGEVNYLIIVFVYSPQFLTIYNKQLTEEERMDRHVYFETEEYAVRRNLDVVSPSIYSFKSWDKSFDIMENKVKEMDRIIKDINSSVVSYKRLLIKSQEDYKKMAKMDGMKIIGEVVSRMVVTEISKYLANIGSGKKDKE